MGWNKEDVSDSPSPNSPVLEASERLRPGRKKSEIDYDTTMCAHAVAKRAAIIFKMSVSLFEVSSNPGVLMRITIPPSRVESSRLYRIPSSFQSVGSNELRD